MAARSEDVARSEANDILWNFGNDTGAIALEDSPGHSSDEETPKKRAPKKGKKRKSQSVVVPELIQIDDSSDEQDTDLDVEKELKRKISNKASNLDDLKIKVSSTRVPRVPTAAEQQASLKSQQSLALLQKLKAQLDAVDDDQPEEDDASLADDEQDEEGSEEEEEEDVLEEKIILKIRWAQREDPVKLRVSRETEMGKLFQKFRTVGLQKGLFGEDAQLSFIFDGEKILESQTAEELDLDDDCTIEVQWS